MALTTTVKKQEEIARSNGAAGTYQGLKGVTQNTGKNLASYQAGYQPGETVQQAQQNLQAVQNQKPQSFVSRYGADLDNILAQINNPEEFKYEFNGDEMFKNYADLYSQIAKQGSMDVMGQAAALTGGYGNSYAQQAAGQAYQQAMLPLFDKGLELMDRAYQRSQDRKNDLKDRYSLLSSQDATDYARYRDDVGDWNAEREYAAGRLDQERNFDYGTYTDMMDYWTRMAQAENADYITEQERLESARKFDAELAEKIRQADLDEAYRRDALKMENDKEVRDLAYRYAMAAIQNGQMPSADLLAQANLSEADARAMMAQMVPAEELEALQASMMGGGVPPVVNVTGGTGGPAYTGTTGTGTTGRNLIHGVAGEAAKENSQNIWSNIASSAWNSAVNGAMKLVEDDDLLHRVPKQ